MATLGSLRHFTPPSISMPMAPQRSTFQLPALDIPHTSLVAGTSIPAPSPTPSPPPGYPHSPALSSIESLNPLRSHPTRSPTASLGEPTTPTASVFNPSDRPQNGTTSRSTSGGSRRVQTAPNTATGTPVQGAFPAFGSTLSSQSLAPTSEPIARKRPLGNILGRASQKGGRSTAVGKLLSIRALRGGNRAVSSPLTFNPHSNDPIPDLPSQSFDSLPHTAVGSIDGAERPPSSAMSGSTAAGPPSLKFRKSFMWKRKNSMFNLHAANAAHDSSRPSSRMPSAHHKHTISIDEDFSPEHMVKRLRTSTPPPILPEVQHLTGLASGPENSWLGGGEMFQTIFQQEGMA